HPIGAPDRFTAPRLQHLLLTLGAAPLLLAGTPDWLLRSVLKAAHLRGFVRWARHPLVAFFSFNAVFSLAHIPSFYELTLASEPLHALEHLVFLGTAMLMWMPVLSPVPDIAPPYPALGQVLYLFLQTVPASLLGALMAASVLANGAADSQGDIVRRWLYELTHNKVVEFSSASPAYALILHVVLGIIWALVYARFVEGNRRLRWWVGDGPGWSRGM